jgi:hypothetical protein
MGNPGIRPVIRFPNMRVLSKAGRAFFTPRNGAISDIQEAQVTAARLCKDFVKRED